MNAPPLIIIGRVLFLFRLGKHNTKGLEEGKIKADLKLGVWS